ncbi:hypothetical protein [Nevskia sp.]|uniref:hypothetical protein n=1 Tax=Nevskia sp. TaxID=1929292 RepID=UPI0025F2D183|nr:hypothetical protein [Nevskia sp.]
MIMSSRNEANHCLVRSAPRHSGLWRAAATLAGLLAAVVQLPAHAQALTGCDWYEAPIKLAYPETNARYYQADLPLLPPAGSRIRIEGSYPATRYFSFQIYNPSYAPVDDLSDYLIVPDPGSQSTLLGPTASNPDVQPGGRYTVYVKYGAVPKSRQRNTLYTDDSISARRQYRLTMRTYLEDQRVPLPKLVLETPNGDQPLGVGLCRPALALPEVAGLAEAGDPGLPGSRKVPFAVFYGAETGDSEFGLNQNAAYMSATVRNTGDLVLIRGRAPSFRERTGRTPLLPEVRYWSFCQNAKLLTTVVDCRADREIPIDANGNYHIVVADGAVARLPKNIGYAALPFGPVAVGFLIYRQLLPAADFVGAIGRVPEGTAPEEVIGDYTPVATYCPPALFEARVRAGDTPYQVFAACAAAP